MFTWKYLSITEIKIKWEHNRSALKGIKWETNIISLIITEEIESQENPGSGWVQEKPERTMYLLPLL